MISAFAFRSQDGTIPEISPYIRIWTAITDKMTRFRPHKGRRFGLGAAGRGEEEGSRQQGES